MHRKNARVYVQILTKESNLMSRKQPQVFAAEMTYLHVVLRMEPTQASQPAGCLQWDKHLSIIYVM